MIVQVDPAPGYGGGHAQSHDTPKHSFYHGQPIVVPSFGLVRWLVPEDEEQRQTDSKEGDELCMTARHSVAFSIHSSRSFLLDQTLQGKVQGLTGQLASKHEANFDLTCRPYQGCVDDTKALWD